MRLRDVCEERRFVSSGSCRCIGRRSESPGGTLTVVVINMFRVLGQAADGLDAVQKARAVHQLSQQLT
jgi:hypothetical protein